MNPQHRTRGGTSDERAVSEVIGAILIFGLVLAVLALIQVSAVPAANQQIEYEHSQRIEGDFQQLDNAIDGAAFDGSRSSTPLELGTRYPVRLFLLNPGPVGGSIRSSASEVRVAGFDAVNDETDDYLQGTLDPFETQSLAYRADYNEYGSAPRIGYEGGILYERYDENAGGRDVLVDRGALVSGRRITVLTLDASLSTQQVDELSLDAVPVSSSRAPVSVEARAGGASITVETSLSEETWKTEVLDTEFDPNGNRANAYVSGIECTSGAADDEPCDGDLRISFEPGETYNLRMAKVGLGSGFDEEGPRYLTTVSGDDTNILTGQEQQLTVEVRDRFNNPVSGVDVTFNPGSGSGSVAPTGPVISDENGRASVAFTPSDGTGSKQVTATVAGGGEERRVTFDVTVTDPDDVGGGGGNPGGPINPYDRSGGLSLTDVSRTDNRFNLTFTNNAEQDLTLTAAQMNFYYFQRPGKPNDPIPRSARLGSPSGNVLLIRGPPEDVTDISFSQGEPRTVPVYFYRDAAGTTAFTETNNDDFFVLSAAVNGRENLYFVSEGPSPVEPNAQFDYSPSNPTNSTVVTFDGSASTDPDGSVVEYRWDFDNDSNIDQTTSTPTVTHTYTTPGSYTAALRVVDNDGLQSNTRTESITVSSGGSSGGPASASLDISLTSQGSGNSGNTYTLTATYSGGSANEYRWDVDNDGDIDQTTTDRTITRTYRSNNKPTSATVTITGSGGMETDTAQYP